MLPNHNFLRPSACATVKRTNSHNLHISACSHEKSDTDENASPCKCDGIQSPDKNVEIISPLAFKGGNLDE